MIKHKSKQTPQEIYWEKKRREEEEKDASLPPGLINHGNTCFMNSTLQGLIATRPLHDLVYFKHVPPAIQPAQGPSILSRRAPQLTNGHGLGGPDDLEWTEGMPLGDIFTTIMRKAWDVQDAKRRETISPKEILTTIGRKYDQYLGFRQQDAHEFLRHMLDAMRMEELDIIKKRQPPPPKTKRKRARRDGDGVPTPPPLPPPALPLPDAKTDTSSVPSTHPQQPDNERPLPPVPPAVCEDAEKLESFVDMLFGGQLASILVCERCKKISLTHEDFNDLSLSIKPEDYVNKDRKRDRIKKIARKLRIRPPSAYANNSWNASGNDKGNSAESEKGSGSAGAKGLRASSVPASPVRRSSDAAPLEEEPPTSVEPRRRSFDHPGEDGEKKRAMARNSVGVGTAPSGLGSAISEDDEEAVVKEDEQEARVVQEVRSEAEVEAGRTEQTNGLGGDGVPELARTETEVNGVGGEEKKAGKDKDDPWGKLARRISVSMKLGKDREKEKDKDKDSRPSSRASDRGRKSDIKDVFRVKSKEPRSPRPSSLAPGISVHESVPEGVDLSSEAAKRASSPTPASPQISSPLRPSGSRRASANPFSRHGHERPIKSPGSSAAPKPSEEDMAYLRRILADVHPVTGNPFSILQNAFSGNGPVNAAQVGTTAALATQAFWAKLGHLPSIEECLRMFTSVEILDGENMVGCHRCWKIANGVYQPRVGEKVDFEEDSDTESEDESSDYSSGKSDQSFVKPPRTASLKGGQPVNGAEEHAALPSPDLSSGRVSPTSPSVTSAAATTATTRQDDASSMSSAPTAITVPLSQSSRSLPLTRKESLMRLQPSTYGGLPIPQISTTEPDTPESGGHSRDVLSQTWSSTRAMMGVSLSDDSLLTPRTRRRGRKSLRKEGADNSGSSSEDDFDDSTSETSAPTSLSDGSAPPSPSLSPRSSVEKLSDTQLPSPLSSPKPQRRRVQDRQVPRSKQVVPRRMYKRYLISTPPPILVVHLKRFQQTNKHAVSLYGGFKKLDEFVAFPEYLDVAPFLAPRREDFVIERAERGRCKSQEKCMYRLYAVVVHIGNMLGGHYVAYTALPNDTPSSASTASAPAPKAEKPVPPTPDSTDSRGSQASDTHRLSRKWAYISDSTVKLTTLEEVLKAKAYICMYERV